MSTEDRLTKKKKQPSFTEHELFVMISEAANRKGILFPSSEGVTRKTKDTAWGEVTTLVNSVSRTRRSEQEVRKKFRDYRSEVKMKLAKHRRETKKTGDGPREELYLKASEEAMINMGLLEQEAVEGIAGIKESSAKGGGTHVSTTYSPAEEPILKLEEPVSVIGLPLTGINGSGEGLDDMKEPCGEKFLPAATREESLTVGMPRPSQSASEGYEVKMPIISTDRSISADHRYTAKDTQESLLGRRSLNDNHTQSWFRVPVPASGDQEESSHQQKSLNHDRRQSSSSSHSPSGSSLSHDRSQYSRSRSPIVAPFTSSWSEDTRHGPQMLEIQTGIRDVLTDLVSSVKEGLSAMQSTACTPQNVVHQNGDISGESRFSSKHDYQTKRKWDNSVDTAVKAIKLIAEQEEKKRECEFECFAMHIASQLKKLPIEKAVALQIEIQNMIGRERLKMLKEENSVSLEHTDQSSHE